MKGKTFLAWGIVAVERSYITKAFLLSQSRWASSGIQRFSRTNKPVVDADESTLSGYRSTLEKEIIEKNMTLATNPVALNRMIDDFYIPVYHYLKSQVDEHHGRFRSDESCPPLFIGVSAPQVSGFIK
jgi:hypothetical protein